MTRRSFRKSRDSRKPTSKIIRPALPNEQESVLEAMGIRLVPLPEFLELAEIIAANFGIKITRNKITLVTSRIHPIMTSRGFPDYRSYVEALKADATGELLSELANHISTNHTAFYREDAHFKLLNNTILPEMIERKRNAGDLDIRIWCAACSTGEEAYTLQFCLMRRLGKDYPNWQAGVLATDISAQALAKAKAGVYPLQRLETVPLDIQYDYFARIDADSFAIRPEVKSEVTFRRLNLMNRTYPLKKPFDIIFCRNVMIYFDQSERAALLNRLGGWLAPGGYLFIGHSESVPELDPSLRYMFPSVYVRRKG